MVMQKEYLLIPHKHCTTLQQTYCIYDDIALQHLCIVAKRAAQCH